MEKAVTVPDQCPLTLNALVQACNQKSSRDPVMNLERAVVQRTARDLETKNLVISEENFRTGVIKYAQRLCNTNFSDYQFTPPEYAVVCVLLLRGAQTPGELRTRCSRLHAFEDNAEVSETLADLMAADREGGPVVARLARVPGRRDHQYAHLLSGEVESVPEDAAVTNDAPARRDRIAELEARVGALESAVAALQSDDS